MEFRSLQIPWLRGARDIACCRCRRRKKKCDKRRPICGECSRTGAECIPLMPKKSSATNEQSARYIQLLEEHIANLETRLQQSNPTAVTDHLAQQSIDEPDTPGGSPSEDDPAMELDAISPSLTALIRPQETTDVPETPPWFFDALVDPNLQGHDKLDANTPQDVAAIVWTPSLDLLGMPSDSRVIDVSDVAGEDDCDVQVDSSRIDMMSERISESYMAEGIASKYATEYFASAHPMWPFLHYKQWDDWWASWRGPSSEQQALGPRAFFIEMVLSVGALLVSSSDPSPDHVSMSKIAYQRAITKYNTFSAEDLSPTMRTQSSLLLTVHAMHLDSVGELFNRATEAIKNCALSNMAYQTAKHSGQPTANPGTDEIIHKMTLRTCVVIDILLSNSMDHKVCIDNASVSDEDLEEQDSESISSEELRLAYPHGDISPSPLDVALEEHMFWLRRIQYRILRTIQHLEKDANNIGHPLPNLWRSRPKHELDKWIQGIPKLSASPERRRRFLSAAWLQKLANYTVMSLFPNTLLAVRGGDAKHLVKAACSVLITFRRLRVKDHTTCYTWTALSHQFQAAVTVVFCLWATPTHQQLEFYNRRIISESLFAGLATLVDFSNKWEVARVFREVFEILTECLPITEYGDPMQQWTIPPARAEDLKCLVDEMEDLKVQPKVVSMIKHILKGPRPNFSPLSVSETQWIQYEHIDD